MARTYQEIKRLVIEKAEMLTDMNLCVAPFIPCMVNEHRCERVFFYSTASAPYKQRSRPYQTMLIDMEYGNVLEYRNAYAFDFANTERYPLGTAMNYSVPKAQTAEEQGQLLEKLDSLYEKVRDVAFAENVDAELLQKYSNCLNETVPAELLRFCADAEPAFFEWLETNA